LKVRQKKLTGTVPLPKHRAGVLPTKVERDRTKATPRQAKHKKQDAE
jgi:hypothetical protein